MSTSTTGRSADSTAQLAELLVQASWRIRRGARKELAPLGVTFGQARVMRVLARTDAPIRMADLAARLEIVPRSVTTMIDSLETAGLVSRQADPHDRRSVLVALTPAGHAVLDRVDAARRERAAALFAPLNAEERAQLVELLSTLDVSDAPAGSKGGER